MDSMRKITITDGPLKGKTVDVQVNETTFTTHAGNGHYEATTDGATWHRKHTATATTEKPAAKPARKRAPKAQAPKPQPPAPADAPVESETQSHERGRWRFPRHRPPHYRSAPAAPRIVPLRDRVLRTDLPIPTMDVQLTAASVADDVTSTIDRVRLSIVMR